MPSPSTDAFAIACGVGGAFVDVSSYVIDDGSRTYSWGRTTQFDDVSPGTFTFLLDNSDGRFTPGNTASPLAVPLIEGMRVSWQVGSRLVSGKIRSFGNGFASMIATSSRVQLVCDDMLGDAARTPLEDSLADSLNVAAQQYALWPMDDDANATYAKEATSTGIGGLYWVGGPSGIVPFIPGRPAIDGLPGQQVMLVARSEVSSLISLTGPTDGYLGNYDQSAGGDGSGFWSMWATVDPSSQFTVAVAGAVSFGWNKTDGFWYQAVGGTKVTSASVFPFTLRPGPFYISVGVVRAPSLSVVMYVNGATFGAASTGAVVNPATWIRIDFGSVSIPQSTVTISRLSFTLNRPREDLLLGKDEAARFAAIAAAAPSVSLASTPPDLSNAFIADSSTSGSALDAFNDVVRTEQGHIFSTTTGTLLAPVEQITVRARNRPSTPAAIFSVTDDISGAPEFVRRLTDMVAAVNVETPNGPVLVTDPTLKAQVGSSKTNETVLFGQRADAVAWGQDRLNRGKVTSLEVPSFTVQAQTTTADRWAELAALKPGDRIRITGLPAQQLGFSTWDGWLLGADEAHSPLRHGFTFHCAPVLTTPIPVFDTDRFQFMASDASAAITVSATSLTVFTTYAPVSQTAVPFIIQLEAEQMLVTAVSAWTGSQSLTVVRGVNGTTAVSHPGRAAVTASGRNLSILPNARFAF